MSASELWWLGYLLNSLWQLPLVFAAAWLVARLVRRVDSRMEHRVWVSALLLEVVLPACHLRLGELLREIWRLVLPGWGGGAAQGQIRIAIGAGAAYGNGVLRLPAVVLSGVAVAYGCSLLYFAGRLGWGLWRTSVMRRGAKPVTLTRDAERSWDRYSRVFGTGTGIEIGIATGVGKAKLAMSSRISGPVTVGIRQGVLLVPPGLLESVGESDLDAVFAHEFAHMQRRDFAKNLVYELLSLPVAYHPLLWLTRSQVAESREMVCDAMAAEAVAGRDKYARSLLRLASMLANRTPVRTLHAIGIFDANIFERRVMNLTRRYVEIKGARRIAIAAACVVVGLGTCVSALALRMEIAGSHSASANHAESNARPKVSAGIMAGNKISGVNPIYPAQARADKVQGAVVLSLTINKEGEPMNIQVKQSVREDLDESAVTAVRQWRWKPYLLNGDPLAVDTTVTVNYSLDN
jgi:TonB family protein